MAAGARNDFECRRVLQLRGRQPSALGGEQRDGAGQGEHARIEAEPLQEGRERAHARGDQIGEELHGPMGGGESGVAPLAQVPLSSFCTRDAGSLHSVTISLGQAPNQNGPSTR